MEECNYCGVDIDNGTKFCTKCSGLFEQTKQNRYYSTLTYKELEDFLKDLFVISKEDEELQKSFNFYDSLSPYAKQQFDNAVKEEYNRLLKEGKIKIK